MFINWGEIDCRLARDLSMTGYHEERGIIAGFITGKRYEGCAAMAKMSTQTVPLARCARCRGGGAAGRAVWV